MNHQKIFKAYSLLFIFGIFSFLFLWDIKINFIQPRFLIILPLLTLFFSYKIFIKNLKNNILLIVVPFIILFHILILSLLYEFELDKRDIFGITLLFLLSLILTEEKEKIYLFISKSISLFVYIFVTFYIIFITISDVNLKIDCYDGWFFNSRFFFVENSHFSIISVPIICFYFIKFCKIKKYVKKEILELLFFFIFLIISFINFSTTFLVGIIISLTILTFKKYKDIFFIIVSIITIIFSLIILSNYKQCIDRSYGSIDKVKNYFKYKEMSNLEKEKFIMNKKTNIENINMSIETYLVSLEITKNSFFEKPLGIGFNKYHLSHKEYIDRVKLIDPEIKKNNIYDGSNNFSKIITEFGIFGFFIILIIPFIFFYKKDLNNIEYFLLVLIGIQFLRGVGYYNGGFILAYIIILREFFRIILKKDK